MPAAPFDPDTLRRQLASPTDAEYPRALQAYRRFYRLDSEGLGVPCESCLGHFDVGHYRVAYQLWRPAQPPRGTLLLVHGYYDHMGLYGHLIAWALGLGLAVLACDLPGHGLSSGARAHIDSFADYQGALAGLLQQARQLQLPAPWHLCGQSMGGAILVDYLLYGQIPDEVGQTLLLAPLVRPRAWRRAQWSYRLLKPFVRQISRSFSENSSDPDFLAFVAQDPLQARVLPTAWVGALARWIPYVESAAPSTRRPLVVQGDADMTVDWSFNLQVLQQKFEAPEVLLLPGARHHLANESPEIRRRYLAFWAERL